MVCFKCDKCETSIDFKISNMPLLVMPVVCNPKMPQQKLFANVSIVTKS